MKIDNPNIVISSLLKKSATFLNVDKTKLINVIQKNNKNLLDKSRFIDRRKTPRINSGRRQIDLINYF